jgi:hypothetical protein
MAINTRIPLIEFLAIKCALKGHFKVKDKEVCENEKTWVLPCLDPNIRPKSVTPCAVQKDIKKYPSPSKIKK